MTSDQSISVRHRGREAALQLLYQWEVGSEGVTRSDEFSEGFWDSHPAPTCRKFATELVKGTMEHLVTIDPLLESTATNWRLDRMALIDRLIMRMAMYELIYTDTPKAVIIDEALELAKTFSGDEAVAFINGILDGACQRLEHEAGSAKQQPAEG